MITKTPGQTEELGRGLAKFLKAGDIIALTGGLGSGKTTFTKGLAEGLGVPNPAYVNSPSFVLLREYKGRTALYHFDLYRLDDFSEIEYIGINEYLDGDGVVVIEWAERLKGLMPSEYLNIDIRIIDNLKREFKFRPHGARYDDIIRRYLKQ